MNVEVWISSLLGSVIIVGAVGCTFSTRAVELPPPDPGLPDGGIPERGNFEVQPRGPCKGLQCQLTT